MPFLFERTMPATLNPKSKTKYAEIARLQSSLGGLSCSATKWIPQSDQMRMNNLHLYLQTLDLAEIRIFAKASMPKHNPNNLLI